MDELLTIDELCKLLKIKKSTAYCWINQRKLPSTRVGRLVRFHKSAIMEWVSQNDIQEWPESDQGRTL